MQNLLSIGHHGILIHLDGFFNINGVIYENPVASVRLLSLYEIERVNIFDMTHPLARFEVEEDMLKSVFKGFVGIDGLVDWDNTEAGLIDTIINCVVMASMQYTNDVISKVEQLHESISVMHQMQAIVSRFLITPFSEVEKLPINELCKRYTLCLKTFPKEVFPIKEQEEDNSDSD